MSKWHSSYTTLIYLTLIALFMSACTPIVPATTPPQLDHTAGSPITIVDNRIIAESFELQFPEGWRVITNVASAPLELILVSPDDETIIRVAQVGTACELMTVTPDATRYTSQTCVGDDPQLRISGETPIAQQANYEPLFNVIVNSIQFR